MALASQEGWLRLWGDWLKMGVHVRACVYAYACVCVHGHVFVWLCFGAESPAKLGKSSCLRPGLPALHFSLFFLLVAFIRSSLPCCRLGPAWLGAELMRPSSS